MIVRITGILVTVANPLRKMFGYIMTNEALERLTSRTVGLFSWGQELWQKQTKQNKQKKLSSRNYLKPTQSVFVLIMPLAILLMAAIFQLILPYFCACPLALTFLVKFT